MEQTMLRKPLIATLTFAILQSGCAQMGMFGDTKSKQFSVQGCLAGGTAAGLLTYVIERGDENAHKKALIASALGCMAGAVVGFKIGERTEEYANARYAAEAETSRNKDTVNRLRQYNASLEVNISDYKKQIQNIRETSLSAQEKREALKKTKEIVSNQRTKAAEALTKTKKELENTREQYAKFKGSLNKEQAHDWEEQLANLEQEKLILSQHINTLNALDASI
jgi:DNA repair exonuclease SbcCD ATPase subunit